MMNVTLMIVALLGTVAGFYMVVTDADGSGSPTSVVWNSVAACLWIRIAIADAKRW